MAILSLAIGSLAMLVTIFGNLWLGKRQFERRNAAGVQEYSNYGSYISTQFKEGAVKAVVVICGVIGVIGIVCGIAGIL